MLEMIPKTINGILKSNQTVKIDLENFDKRQNKKQNGAKEK